ncbi:MAG: succinate dehydrogenase, hydrophobic membrane anchor protein [Woeseiaceae bacterium]|jgi:succinate dehydrogenase / fumarate reductase membrane anchor subunit|nr:succinate dehydrogenase, hydrophobic membrane anchor protein [Woeseiaceae bacterium]
MNLSAPMNKVLYFFCPRSGTSHFWAQRLSAVGTLITSLWFVYAILNMPGFQYSDALTFIAAPLNSIMLFFLIIVMAYHSSLGVQVVIEDYIHAHKLKLITLILSRFMHVFFVAAAVYAIIKIRLSI